MTRRCSGMKDRDLASLWMKRLAEYKASGQSITAWCRENALTEGQYHYWRRKLGPQPGEQVVKWVAVSLDLAATEGKRPDPVPVHIGQFTVEVKPGFDENLLLNVFKVLKAIC